jgi:hypothetical protein
VTGRISGFIPFLPFSPGEAAVVAHKFLMQLGNQVSRPINLTPGPNEQLVGNIHMRIRRDATVCGTLATEHYCRDLGARSLMEAATVVERALIDAYLDGDTDISEDDVMREFIVDVQGGEIVGKIGSGN